jgi:hypothetical protein
VAEGGGLLNLVCRVPFHCVSGIPVAIPVASFIAAIGDVADAASGRALVGSRSEQFEAIGGVHEPIEDGIGGRFFPSCASAMRTSCLIASERSTS